MKRLDYTKVSVKLKKSEWRDEWFIYLEAYPVYETGNDKPKRVREYLRRSITTPIWDKRRSERAVAGRIKYKPKRDDNGVIQCKPSKIWKLAFMRMAFESCVKKEYDNNGSLY